MKIKTGTLTTVDDLKLATPCLICNESIEFHGYPRVLVCQKCKGAILYMRDKLDKEGINYANYYHGDR